MFRQPPTSCGSAPILFRLEHGESKGGAMAAGGAGRQYRVHETHATDPPISTRRFFAAQIWCFLSGARQRKTCLTCSRVRTNFLHRDGPGSRRRSGVPSHGQASGISTARGDGRRIGWLRQLALARLNLSLDRRPSRSRSATTMIQALAPKEHGRAHPIRFTPCSAVCTARR